MTTLPATTRIPAAAAVPAGADAQLVDDRPGSCSRRSRCSPPISALLAVALTAGAAGLVTRRLDGRALARTGLRRQGLGGGRRW
jgi:hypothetical protein